MTEAENRAKYESHTWDACVETRTAYETEQYKVKVRKCSRCGINISEQRELLVSCDERITSQVMDS